MHDADVHQKISDAIGRAIRADLGQRMGKEPKWYRNEDKLRIDRNADSADHEYLNMTVYVVDSGWTELKDDWEE